MTQMVRAGTATPDQLTGLIQRPSLDGFNTYLGDANLDGEFNSCDLTTVFQAAKYELDEDAGWAEGDWTGDGQFDTADLVAHSKTAATKWGRELQLRPSRNHHPQSCWPWGSSVHVNFKRLDRVERQVRSTYGEEPPQLSSGLLLLGGFH